MDRPSDGLALGLVDDRLRWTATQRVTTRSTGRARCSHDGRDGAGYGFHSTWASGPVAHGWGYFRSSRQRSSSPVEVTHNIDSWPVGSCGRLEAHDEASDILENKYVVTEILEPSFQ